MAEEINGQTRTILSLPCYLTDSSILTYQMMSYSENYIFFINMSGFNLHITYISIFSYRKI